MKIQVGWFALAALLALGVLVGPARADEDKEAGRDPGAGTDPAAAMAESSKMMTAMVNGMTKFTGSTRLTEANVSALLKHGRSFLEIGKTASGKDEVEDALDANYKKTGRYDFELAFRMAPFAAWAGKTGVEARPFAQAFMRFQAIEMRKQFMQSAEKMRKSMPKQLAELEKMRSMMGEENFKQAKKAIDMQVEMAKGMEATAKAVPEATPDEKKLIAKHGAALKKVLDEDDGDDEGMGHHDDDDDHGGKDEDGDHDDDDDHHGGKDDDDDDDGR